MCVYMYIYLVEEGKGGLLVGDGASNGDEFALFDFFFECHSLLDGRESTNAITAAAGDHGSLGCGGGEKKNSRRRLSLK